MITTTLPPAASRSPYDHLTIRNASLTDMLEVTVYAGDFFDVVGTTSFIIPVASACTLQSNEVDGWYAIHNFRPLPQKTAAPLSADTVITTTLAVLPGTTFTADYPGLFVYNLFSEVSVVNIPGNQAWDVDIGLYNVTESSWVYSQDWLGAGDPLVNPSLQFSNVFEMLESDIGDTFGIAAVRATTTGTVTAIAAGTGNNFTGPL